MTRLPRPGSSGRVDQTSPMADTPDPLFAARSVPVDREATP
jgi:hypothetical protein